MVSEKSRFGLIELSVQEARRFFVYFYSNIQHAVVKLLEWSAWRRKHQALAKFYHYQRNEMQLP